MSTKRIVIAGGGFAALEAALALQALAKERVQITLISPNAGFAYRPSATLEAFDDAPPITYGLDAIAADLGATYHRAGLEAVASQPRWVRLDSGMKLGYDFLILAVGARASVGVPGALTFRDQRDLGRLRILLDEVAAGTIDRLAFAVPSRDAWSLPAYELAFLAATHAEKHGASVAIVVVSPEPTPLAVFGAQASRLVAGMLEERHIRFVSAIPHSVCGGGALALQFDAPLAVDRVVAVPELHGPRITGVPTDWSGFVAVDGLGRVAGLEDVYAAGDMTTYPIKQGGLAAQQADLVAETIATDLGAPVKKARHTRILRARLLAGDGAVVLRTELDALGRPTTATVEHWESRAAADVKVFGRYLTPYLSMYRSRAGAAA
jgi:sulfide:quinone oxidoreductase